MKNRKLNRLKGHNYSSDGYYFVTICTHHRREWFGEIRDGKMVLNKHGEIILRCWNDLPIHYDNLKLDMFVIMPNHVHAIVVIQNPVGNGLKPFPTKPHGLSEIIRAFKTFSSRRINENIRNSDCFRWQKSFYDHIIRTEPTLDQIRTYITNNPLQWAEDVENPAARLAGLPAGRQAPRRKIKLF